LRGSPRLLFWAAVADKLTPKDKLTQLLVNEKDYLQRIALILKLAN